MGEKVTILILIDGFLQCVWNYIQFNLLTVTILILIDGFLQYILFEKQGVGHISHNPYFNRWFSAIQKNLLIKLWKVKSQSLF